MLHSESGPWADPYCVPGTYRRVQLHTHTNMSFDGRWSLAELARVYSSMGFYAVFITDHDLVPKATDLELASRAVGSDGSPLLLLPGEESTIVAGLWPLGRHLVRLFPGPSAGRRGTRSARTLLASTAEAGGLASLAHPSWVGNFGLGKWPHRVALGLAGVALCEVCNYHSSPDRDTAAWDALIRARGPREPIWAVAVDDAHHAGRAGKAWVEVKLADSPPDASGIATGPHPADGLRQALTRGSFYATTGLAVEFAVVSGPAGTPRVVATRRAVPASASALYASPDSVCTCRFIADGAIVCETTLETQGPAAEFAPTGGERYVRVEVSELAGQGQRSSPGRRAWSQPFWRSEV